MPTYPIPPASLEKIRHTQLELNGASAALNAANDFVKGLLDKANVYASTVVDVLGIDPKSNPKLDLEAGVFVVEDPEPAPVPVPAPESHLLSGG